MTTPELRMLFIIGLIVAAALAYATVMGAFAAAAWLRRVGERMLHRPALATPAARRAGRAATDPIPAAVERRVRRRQAEWRLRC